MEEFQRKPWRFQIYMSLNAGPLETFFKYRPAELFSRILFMCGITLETLEGREIS